MSRARRCLSILALCAAITLMPAAAMARGLVLDVQAPTRSAAGQPLQIALELLNDGSSPIVFAAEPGWGPGGGLTLSVSRNGFGSIALPEDAIAVSDVPQAQRVVTFDPGQAVGLFRYIPGKALAAPGTYSIQVRYDGPDGVVLSPIVQVVVSAN